MHQTRRLAGAFIVALLAILLIGLIGEWSAAQSYNTTIKKISVNNRIVPTVIRTGGLLDGSPAHPGIVNPGFDSGLNGWTVVEQGGTNTPGKVHVVNGEAELLEGDSFLVSLQQTFKVLNNPHLEFDLRLVPGFDRTAQFIPDAFEAQLLDANLKSVVPTWNSLATSFFNIQEDGTVLKGAATTYDGKKIRVDLSGVAPGTVVTLFLDLIGGDGDTKSGVRVDNVFPGLPPGSAHTRDYEPASVLLFPTVDSRSGEGKGTILSVTNTNASTSHPGRGKYRHGDVQLHFYYVGENCGVSNRVDHLTPSDTLTVIAGNHNPSFNRGYLYVVAEDAETDNLINYNYLIGSEIIVDAKNNKLWSIPAIGFKCNVLGGVTDRNGRFLSDFNQNNNGSFDFDGYEYDFWPDTLMISSFFNQDALMEGELVLVSGLGKDYKMFLDVEYFNNDEVFYSRAGYLFMCWTSTVLLDISMGFGRLMGSPRELDTGWCRMESGGGIHVYSGKRWKKNEGAGGALDAPLIGAYMERIKGSPFEYGRLLHHAGAQNGNEFPWREDS